MLRSARGTRSCGCICIPPWSASVYKGLGENGRCSMASGDTDGGIYLLGRPANKTNLLQGESVHSAPGSNLRLFMPTHGSGTNADIRMPSMMPLSLCTKLRGIKATQAIHYLEYTFNAHRCLIVVNGLHTTPQKLVQDLPGLEILYAHEVYPLTFWGGPPNRERWYDGTLLTLLADRVLIALSNGDKNLLERFVCLAP